MRTLRRLRRGETRALILVVLGVVSCFAYGPIGLADPLLLAVFWLAELGAFHE